MAKAIRETREVSTSDDTNDTVSYGNPVSLLARAIYVIATLIIVLLALRFLLALLGANKGNAFTDFIYVTSQPFVAPFFGMFNYRARYGISTVELETLFAIFIYGIVAWALVYLLGLSDTDGTIRQR